MQWFIYDLRHLPFGTRPRTQRMLACFAGLLFGTFAVLSLPVEVGASSPNVVAQPTDLGTLGGTSSGAIAVSASGQVVGESTTAGDTATHAFSWTAGGGMVDLGTLGGTNSFLTILGSPFEGNGGGVNDRGQVVGGSSISGDTALRRLGHWFGTSGQFWLNLQSAYDIRVAAQESKAFEFWGEGSR